MILLKLFGGIFSGGDVPAPQPLPVAPSLEDPAVAEAKRKALLAGRKANRQATVLTSGDGLADEEPLLNKSALLGG